MKNYISIHHYLLIVSTMLYATNYLAANVHDARLFPLFSHGINFVIKFNVYTK